MKNKSTGTIWVWDYPQPWQEDLQNYAIVPQKDKKLAQETKSPQWRPEYHQ
jgi:hypothetical protein